MEMDEMRREAFERDGFVVVEDLLDPAEVAACLEVYGRFLDGRIDAGPKRSDLGAHAPAARKGVENITQIMWPSALLPDLLATPCYERALAAARGLLGPDVDMDFDMLIDKAPLTGTPTPWHQDRAYWIDLPDLRAASAWLALDEATVENGCMWFVPGSHREPLRHHRPAATGGALSCEAGEAEAVAVPLRPGSATFHAGGTVHGSRGNSTGGHRRAWILNFRPRDMIRLERDRGFDHGRTVNRRELRSDQAR
jgi:phytanoyl-CoA hydroxylase